MKIAWYLVGTRRTGSSRMECYHLHDFLTRTDPGSSEVRWSPEEHRATAGLSPEAELAYLKHAGVDLVVFQKLSDDISRELARRCREQGIATVFVICDYRGDLTMVPLCTATIVTSSNLLELVTSEHPQSDVTFCQYGTEAPPEVTPAFARGGNRSTELVYLGSVRLSREFGFLNRIAGTRLTTIGPYEDYDERLNSSFRARLRTELAWRARPARPDVGALTSLSTRPLPTTRPWHPETVYKDLASCDIGVIPLEGHQLSSVSGRMKSNSRLLSMWGVGLATITSPLKSYVETINHGVDGFIAASRRDWIRLITLLRRNPELRVEIARNARARAFGEFRLERQYRAYMAVFTRAQERAGSSRGAAPGSLD